jgi:hypothetical protein
MRHQIQMELNHKKLYEFLFLLKDDDVLGANYEYTANKLFFHFLKVISNSHYKMQEIQRLTDFYVFCRKILSY